jgi:hypothetical protein
MSLDLRPLTLGELLDRSFSLYRRHFWVFVGVMALPSLVALALGLLMVVMFPPSSAAAPPQTPDPAQLIGTVAWILGGFAGIMVIYWVTYAVAQGATTAVVSQIYAGRPVSIGGGYAPMRGKIGRLAWLLLLISLRLAGLMVVGVLLIMVIGVLAGVLVGVFGAVGGPTVAIVSGLAAVVGILVIFVVVGWVALRYTVAVPAAVLEDQTAGNAIRRSVQLTKGSLGRVFVLLLFTMIITYAVMFLFQGPFLVASEMAGPESPAALWLALLGTVAGSVGSAFTAPLMVVAFAVLYYDLRIRKEGLDLQLMMASLDAGREADVTSQPSAVLPR